MSATGQTAAVTFGTSSISLDQVTIEHGEEGVDTDVARPHLGLALGDGIPYDPGDLVENGEMTITFEDDHSTDLPRRGPKEVITITQPVVGSNSTGASFAYADAYIKSVDYGTYQTSERRIVTMVIKKGPNPTYTAGAP